MQRIRKKILKISIELNTESYISRKLNCNQLSGFIERVAAKNGARFLDAGATISADASDGIHMNAEGHARMAELIHAKVREIFPE